MQVLYSCRLGQRLRVVLAPFGARGRDAAFTLNPVAGQVSGAARARALTVLLSKGVPAELPAPRQWLRPQCCLLRRALLPLAPTAAAASTCLRQGLTSLVREGSPLHRGVLGSLVGVALDAPRAWLSAGYFARGTRGPYFM